MNPARYHREMAQRYRMEAGKCKKCGHVYFPPRLICRECQGREFETIVLSERGKLLSFTVIHTPASQFKDISPYALGILETKEGAKLTAQIVDMPADQIKTGMELQIEFRRVQTDGHEGVLAYGYKLVPVM
ncbi:MAG: Zn-ribbon domain-containing OB-fold protein [bacterium]|nr:Zn-ribbon domain-containing OB-fold protein [bacterium]